MFPNSLCSARILLPSRGVFAWICAAKIDNISRQVELSLGPNVTAALPKLGKWPNSAADPVGAGRFRVTIVPGFFHFNRRFLLHDLQFHRGCALFDEIQFLRNGS